MKKAVIFLCVLTVLMMGACAEKNDSVNESRGRSRIRTSQDNDQDDQDTPDDDVLTEYDGADENIESAVYDIEKIYTDDLFKEIIEGDETPVFVGYGLGGESGYVTASSTDPEVINGFIEAFREVTVKSIDHNPESDMYVADGGEDIAFGMEDGRQFNIALDGRIWIHTDAAVFELDNTGRLSEMCVMMQEVAYMNQAGGDVPDDYIAVIRGGAGESSSETYVYETDKGYKYINVTSTSVSWGSPQQDHVIDKTGTAASKKEVVEIAGKHGADSFVTYPGSPDPYPIEDFLSVLSGTSQ
ncbi:MAG: hypothetical protein K5686_11900 [Lachnospiraceae bacterium]|nr:hypothetical protein [Lachnospiraceae bacterium]